MAFGDLMDIDLCIMYLEGYIIYRNRNSNGTTIHAKDTFLLILSLL